MKARQQRRRKIAAGVLAGVITVGAVLLVVSVVRSSGSSAAAAPTPTASAPPASLAEGRTWTSVLTTSVGAITLELDGAVAPQAVGNFVSLSQSGFYDGTSCHRLTTAATDASGGIRPYGARPCRRTASSASSGRRLGVAARR